MLPVASVSELAAQAVGLEPLEHRFGDLVPTIVDGERVAAGLELLEFGDSGGIPVLLERGPGDDIGHGVVGGSGDEQQRSARGVRGVDLGLRMQHEVGCGGLEQGSRGRRNRPLVEQFGGFRFAERIAESEAELARSEPEPEPLVDTPEMQLVAELKPGIWLEFVTGPETVERAKLSWISPMSGRYLFVNRRGLKVASGVKAGGLGSINHNRALLAR